MLYQAIKLLLDILKDDKEQDKENTVKKDR